MLVCAKSPGLVPPRPMLLIVTAPAPVLASVIDWAVLVVPTGRLPNERDVGVRLTDSAVPVPERLAVCGLFVALSVTVKVAVRVPEVAGVKVTLMVQLAPAARLVPQLLLCAKLLLFVPLRAMLVMLSAVLWGFDSVTA